MSTSLRWSTRLGAVAAIGMLGLAVAAGPASAQTVDQVDNPNCPDQYFCVWTGTNFTGDNYIGYVADGCWRGFPSGGGHSMANQTRATVMAFANSDCTGASFTLEPGYDTANSPFPIYGVWA